MLLPIYSRPALIIDHGEGCYLWDTAGRRYLDFVTGIGVNALGHNHPRITQVIQRQAGRCLHTSNLYHHSYQEPLAEKLSAWSGGLSHVFFGNSGAEAFEAALKAAKAYGAKISAGKYHLVAIEGSFHGRTLGALSVTGRHKYRQPFLPMLPGVTFIPANNIDTLRAAVTDDTAAILLEVIQGENGVYPMDEAFLREVRRLADFHDALWIADETQCGLGRTGWRFAYQQFPGLLPDIALTAKPLAAGIPLSAAMFNEKAAAAIGMGQHGTTFGGGPLACRVALEVLDIIEELLPAIRETGAYLRSKLIQLQGKLPLITEVRGAGMMVGLQLNVPANGAVQRAMEEGLLINCAHETVIRLLPPFISTKAEVDEAMDTLAAVCLAGQKNIFTSLLKSATS